MPCYFRAPLGQRAYRGARNPEVDCRRHAARLIAVRRASSASVHRATPLSSVDSDGNRRTAHDLSDSARSQQLQYSHPLEAPSETLESRQASHDPGDLPFLPTHCDRPPRQNHLHHRPVVQHGGCAARTDAGRHGRSPPEFFPRIAPGPRPQHADDCAGCRRKKNRTICILQDLQGPKIRTGRSRASQPVVLKSGAQVTITPADVQGTRRH